ncbi:MAG: response regulator [Ferruginibacter sp.]|nr:response regulator [Ferruginibacter sp.]
MATILVVDDSEHLIALLSQILIQNGYKVETAVSKKELVNHLLNLTPDLIFLDIRLSGDDGRKICRDLKANSSYKNIPIILMSADADLLETFAEYGANDMINKPFDRALILDKAAGLLKPAA